MLIDFNLEHWRVPVTMRVWNSMKILDEQPYDEFLLNSAKIYQTSRRLFLKQGGKFKPALLSSARALGSAGLLDNFIEYSPVGTELHWSRTDRYQRNEHAHIAAVHGWITGVYHEQNHRTLWSFFRKQKWFCPTKVSDAYRFLNLTESLVVILDMALSDSLDDEISSKLYSQHVIYSPGSKKMRSLKVGSSQYREVLLICLHATFLRLEGLHPDDLPGVIQEVFLNIDRRWVKIAVERSLRLEPRFVDLTNPIWQKKHVKKVIESMGPSHSKSPTLILPDRDPSNHTMAFTVATAWLKYYNL